MIFKTNGTLNVSRAATDISEEDMQRCLNLSVDRFGRFDTRRGSTKANGVLFGLVNFIIEQNGNRYSFSSTSSSSAIYKNEDLLLDDLSAGQWCAIKYNQFNSSIQQVFALNGTERKRISGDTVHEWGIDAPDNAPVLGVGSGTGLTGDYNVKYTYAVKEGSTVVSESNPSDAASSAQTLSNQDLEITWTNSSDSQVTHVRLYRTLPGGETYFHDQDVAISASTIDTSTADSALGSEVATNHDRPPAGQIVAGPFYDGTCFIVDGNKLHYCLPKQPEYWPSTNFIEIGSKQQPTLAMADFAGQAYALTKDRLWFIEGPTAGDFEPCPLKSLTGAPNLFGALGIEGRGLYHIGPDGIYLYSGGVDRKITQDNFEPLFRGEAVNDMASVDDVESAWLHQFENRIYMHYGSGSVLVNNLDNGRWTFYKYDSALYAPSTDKTNERFYTGDDSSRVRRIEDDSAEDDAGSDIAWDWQTKDVTLQTRAHFPRWAKYDVDTTDATGTIYLDDTVHQTHALTVARKTRRRLIKEGNGNRMSHRVNGTGSVTLYATELE